MIRLKSLLKEQVQLTAEQEAWLDKCTGGTKETKFGARPTIGARTWDVDNQGYVTVNGNFECYSQGLTDFKGIKFKEVTGNFDVDRNILTSLAGAPQTVGGRFYCNDNKLTSLKGAPQTVGGDFDCSVNKLASLEGAPQIVKRSFDCSGNILTSLNGIPKFIGGDLKISGAAINRATSDEIRQELDYLNVKLVGDILR